MQEKEKDMLTQIYSMQRDLNKFIGRDTIADIDKQKWLFDYTEALEAEARELKDCCLWKWWVKEYKDNPNDQFNKIINFDNAKIEAIDILHFLMSIFQILDMSPTDIFEIYKNKHKVNVERQNNNYSLASKTEDDNKTIEKKMHNPPTQQLGKEIRVLITNFFTKALEKETMNMFEISPFLNQICKTFDWNIEVNNNIKKNKLEFKIIPKDERQKTINPSSI